MNNLHRPGGKSKNFTYVHFTCRNFQPMRHNIFLSLWPLYRISCWALSLVKIEFGHLRSRRRIELLWWWCHAKQCIPNPSLTKLFCPFFCQTPKKVISPVFQPKKTDPSSTVNSTAFVLFLLHHFELSSGSTLYLLLNVCRRSSTWISRVLPLFISLVLVPFCFLQFASITLRLIGHMHWSFFWCV